MVRRESTLAADPSEIPMSKNRKKKDKADQARADKRQKKTDRVAYGQLTRDQRREKTQMYVFAMLEYNNNK